MIKFGVLFNGIKKDKIVFIFIFFVATFGLLINCEAARPFSTDDAPTVDIGGYEVELGCDFNKETWQSGFSFKHGLTKSLDLGISFGYIINIRPKYISPKISLKYAIIQNILSFSFINELGTPNYNINFILTKNVFEFVEFAINIGYAVISPSQLEETDTIIYALAAIVEFENWDIGIEATGDKEGFNNWLAGKRFKFFDGFNFDAAISGSFKDFCPEKIIGTIGIHYEFNVC